MTSGSTQWRPGDQAVEQTARAFAAAWNRHDMQALAALFTPEADFVNVIGLHWRGRHEIRRAHEELHSTRMKDSRLTIREASHRLLRPDLGLVHATWDLVGDTRLSGTVEPPREGVLSMVVVREGDRWLIEAAQNTDIVRIPNVPSASAPPSVDGGKNARRTGR